jgi:UDP-2,4-diacetamido-2,4,6-trideoxy-beta-L-altropyranose hydrolase
MNVAFRVDASSTIGTGHLMRCLTLADEMKKRGASSCFFSRHMPEHLRDMLTDKGHLFKPLHSPPQAILAGDLAHAEWLGTTLEADAKDAILAMSYQTWDWLVVDHYALDVRWESALRQTVKRILVIDDLADRKHNCDVLLDQNFYADMGSRYVCKVPDECQLLLGPRYALLREEFRQLRDKVNLRNGLIQRIFVFFGGVDAENYTGHAIQALIEVGIPNIHVDVVVGQQHPCLESIKAACLRYSFACHVQTDKMAELMVMSDLSIGAGGGATWERCCLGLPTLTICTAQNQRKQIADAASEGLLYSPDFNVEVSLMIARHLSSLIENSCLRKLISVNGVQAVDGQGALRVIGRMGFGEIDIRTARADDSQHLFAWRNHSTIREASRNSDVIKWEDHSKWFSSVLRDSNRCLVIGESAGIPVGVVRFDIQNDQAEISIYLVPETKISGRGYDLLQSAEQWFSLNYPDVKILRAHVLGTNERSQQFFWGAGYQVESTSCFKRLH